MTTNKAYFLPITSSNLNSVFASESISPHKFYEQRNFGIPYNSLTDDNGIDIQPVNSIVLYNDLFEFKPSQGSPAFLIIIETALNKDYLFEDVENQVYYYFNTIYLRKGNFFVCFPTETDKFFFFAMVAPSIEVKTIKKFDIECFFHHLQKKHSIFITFDKNESLNKRFKQKIPYYPKMKLVNTNVLNHLCFDKAYNHIKGFIYGYLVGILNSKSDQEVELEQNFQEMHNTITGIKGKIEINQSYKDEYFDDFINLLANTKKIFFSIFPSLETYIFDNISLRIKELCKYQHLRFADLAKQLSHDNQNIVSDLKKEYEKVEDEILKIRIKENDLKEIKENFENEYKAIKRPKKNTDEFNQKQLLKEKIDEIKLKISEVKELKQAKNLILNRFKEELHQNIVTGKTQYDNSVEDQYLKISGYINDLMLLTNSQYNSTNKTTNIRQIDKFLFNIKSIILKYSQNVDNEYIINLSSELDENISVEETLLFQTIINTILANPKTNEENLQQRINDIVNLVVLDYQFKIKNTTDKTDKIINQLKLLLDFRNNVSQEFSYITNSSVVNSFIAFVFRSQNFDELQKFMFMKGFGSFHFAFSIWATYHGFANLPKTFTDKILESNNDEMIDYIDNYLFVNYLIN